MIFKFEKDEDEKKPKVKLLKPLVLKDYAELGGVLRENGYEMSFHNGSIQIEKVIE